MAGPVKGAMIGALIFEGKAKTPEEAEKMLASGKIEFAPCHDHRCSGPMAGVISPSQLVYVVENKTHEIKCFGNMNEGRGKVLRMGAYSEDVLDKLNWMETVLGPTVKAAWKHSVGSISAPCSPKPCTWATTVTTAWMPLRCSLPPNWRPTLPRLPKIPRQPSM